MNDLIKEKILILINKKITPTKLIENLLKLNFNKKEIRETIFNMWDSGYFNVLPDQTIIKIK